MKEKKNLLAGAAQGWAVGAVVFGLAGSAFADLSMTFGDLKDAMIFGTSGNADTNMSSGKGPGMFAGADGSLNRKRSLLQFDIVDNIPAGAHITGVTLKLILGQVAGSGTGGSGSNIPTRTINLFDLQQDWSEGASGSPTSTMIGASGQGFTRVPGDVGWTYANYPGTTWPAGGDFNSASPSASSTFSFPFNTGSAYTWSTTGMVADVQDWLDHPSDDHGWLLKAMNGINSSNQTVDLEATTQSFLGFWTRDGAAANSDPTLAPALTVTFTVPEPTSMAILLLATPLIGRRRRPAQVGCTI